MSYTIPFKQSPNYEAGIFPKKAFIWHGTLGAYNGAVDTLTDGNAEYRVSAHYVIGREEGQVVQLVKETDKAWHAGKVSNPNARGLILLEKNSDGSWKNPNIYTIGIEFCWGYDIDGDGIVEPGEKRINDWQMRCVNQIMQDSGIPVTKDTIFTHHDITDYKGDDLTLDIASYWQSYPEQALEIKGPETANAPETVKTPEVVQTPISAPKGNIWDKFMNWLSTSSIDPEKTSLTVKTMTGGAVLLGVSTLKNIGINVDAVAVTHVIDNALICFTAVLGIYAIVRKVYLTLTGKAVPVS